MTKKIEISRELLDRMINALDDEGWHTLANEAAAILAAPAVERQEPVAWMYNREGGEVLGQLVQMESDELKAIRLGKCHDNGTRYLWPREDYIEWKPLYTSPPAPVSVVLPDRAAFEAWRDRRNAAIAEHGGSASWYVSQAHYATWEACLDKFKEMNG